MFSFYNIKIYFSDMNFDSPIVNSLSHNLKITMLRLKLVALPRIILVTPLFHSQRVMILLIILQKVSKLAPVFESDGGDKIKSETFMPPSRLFLLCDVFLIFDVNCHFYRTCL